MPHGLCGHVTTFGCDHGLSCCIQKHRQHGRHRSSHTEYPNGHRGHTRGYNQRGHHRSSHPHHGHNSHPHGKQRQHSDYNRVTGGRHGHYSPKHRGHGYNDRHNNAHNRGYSRRGHTHVKDSAPYDKDISSSFHEFQNFMKEFDDIDKQINSYSASHHHTGDKNYFDSYASDRSSHEKNSYGSDDIYDSSYSHEGYNSKNGIHSYPDQGVNKGHSHHPQYDDGFKDIHEVNKMMSDLLLEDESKSI